MEKLTGYNLITFINQLPKNQSYNYINPRNKGLIKILDVSLPDGPITFKRWNPSKFQSIDMVNTETISSDMIWRFANALSYKQPVNVDRIFGGSYNTRSVLETLVAHTPQFYFCYPGRIMEKNGSSTIEHGHKHLLWYPSSPHINGRIQEIKTEITISEVPGSVAVYDSLVLPDIGKYNKNDHEILRRHSQIQISLYLIGLQLGYRTWIAQNDNRIVYHDKPLIEHEGIISSLQMENLVQK